MTEKFALVIFAIGLVFSSALSLILLAAAIAVGFQPASLSHHLVTTILIMLPMVALLIRIVSGGSVLNHLILGLIMIIVSSIHVIFSYTTNW